MVSFKTGSTVLAVFGMMCAGSMAWAQEETQLGEGTPRCTVPPGTEKVEEPPPPPAPSVMLPQHGVTKQAGVGSPVAYGRAGVLELGGSAGFSAASNYTRFQLSPSVG